MNFQVIGMIARNTFSNEWRSRAIFFLSALTSLFLIFAVMFLYFIKDQFIVGISLEGLGLQVLGGYYFFLNLWSYLISIYFGVSCIRADAENAVLPQILSFPLGRREYLAGRVLGIFILVSVYYCVSLLVATGAISFVIGPLEISPQMFLGFFVNLIPNFIVILFSFLIGPYFGKLPSFLGVIFFILFHSAANGVFMGKSFDQFFVNMTPFSGIQFLSYALFPHIVLWGDLGNSLILSQKIDFNIPFEMAHLLISGGFLFCLVYWRFKKYEV